MIKKIINVIVEQSKPKRWAVLSGLIKKYEIESYCEVGVWTGENIKKLRTTFPYLEIIGIDPYLSYGDGEISCESTSQTEMDKIWESILALRTRGIFVERTTSKEASKKEKNYEMVFIDGDHSYKSTKEDIELWLPKATKILCGHDYTLDFFGVITAVNEVLGVGNVSILPNGIWVYRVKQ